MAAIARRMLHELDATSREISQIGSGFRGTITVGSVTGPSVAIILPAIQSARARYPENEISLIVDTSDKLAGHLLARRLDFYVGRVPADVDTRALATRVVGPEPFCLVVREGHPLLEKQSPTLEDYTQYEWIMQPPGGLARHMVELYLLEHDCSPPERVISTSSLMVTLAFIQETDAIAPLASAVADFWTSRGGGLNRVRVLPLASDMAILPYALVTRQGESLSAAATRFYDDVSAKLEFSDAATFSGSEHLPKSLSE
ncbi:LysR substrate-binding domain-containing protein [Pelagibacterium montanilacus]|uniref:LysR substrate-binding domain-containing protein n=1 Tax=Pelagibacterium montanilacus TaxID=2185280 RepID=UPI0013E073A7|nr:LysR substrate-binding domain-containing protein [Pelagibacterium montanilacus]